MSKPQNSPKVGENEALAIARMLRTSPRKLDLVAGLIRGQKVGVALNALSFSARRIAREVKKTLQSAIANAENNQALDVDRLYVVEASVGKSLVMKRMHPRGRGRSAQVLKPFSQLRIVLRERAEAA